MVEESYNLAICGISGINLHLFKGNIKDGKLSSLQKYLMSMFMKLKRTELQ